MDYKNETMKFILHLLALAIAVHFISIFFDPKWSWLVLVLYGALLSYSRWSALMLGFASVFVVWLSYTLYLDIENAGLLSHKIGVLLGNIPGSTLPWVSALIGGIGGTLSSWLGYELGNWFR